MLKYIKPFSDDVVSDKRTIEEKVNELKQIGISISVRDKNSEYEEGYILGKPNFRASLE